MMILTGVLIFLLCLINDFLAVLFVRRVAAGRALQASLCAVGIEIIAFITILAWVQSAWFLFPACGGVFLGTYIMVKYDSKKGG